MSEQSKATETNPLATEMATEQDTLETARLEMFLAVAHLEGCKCETERAIESLTNARLKVRMLTPKPTMPDVSKYTLGNAKSLRQYTADMVAWDKACKALDGEPTKAAKVTKTSDRVYTLEDLPQAMKDMVTTERAKWGTYHLHYSHNQVAKWEQLNEILNPS